MVDTCRNGHERSAENASWSGGYLGCKPCNREKSRRHLARLEAAGKKRKRSPDKRQQQPRPVSEADIARVKARIVVDANDCWIWQGSINPANGYGYTRVGGRVRSVHRALYEALAGEVADGLVLDHLCRNRPCANPKHLEPVPQSVNIARGEHRSAVMARTGKCARGHEQTLENTVSRKGGRTQCRICQNAASRAGRVKRVLGVATNSIEKEQGNG